ncbi:Predicted DNA-binding transcriptional regulator YafY, contains an HTH and WYL domains [Sediminibacillus halophilus]|uniref:Predicted DNA-binding transcriptional regulator YafY, contains an HTH and WYL domains n=2 Tax=Sediminibacillus halophilus TaxID=482461 RepID=A0A1G9PBV4_9BACI|nr:Predicted DNA-binding transcriptional regulator YafY, contains an HTH and WYL domains [Sediminibacillus halophilus]
MMRGDRLISILLLLQSYNQLTAKQLSEKLEVSERTIYRDMDALSRIGIPVIAERGKQGGWSLLNNYKTSLTGFKETEVHALFISYSIQLLEDLGLKREADDARNKLFASLPAVQQNSAKAVWNRIYIDTSSWRQKQENAASFSVLQQAIWDTKKLRIEYQRADGSEDERIVKPLGLVAKGNKWYFIAGKENNEIRSYRISRIQTAKPIDETFIRPNNFDLASYWDSTTNAFIEHLPEYPVSVEVTKKIMPRLTFTGRFVRILEVKDPSQEGWIPVDLVFNTEEEAAAYILGFANQIRVLKPKRLHSKVSDMAKATAAFYQQND